MGAHPLGLLSHLRSLFANPLFAALFPRPTPLTPVPAPCYNPAVKRAHARLRWAPLGWIMVAIALAGCAPSPAANVLGYLLAQRTGGLISAPAAEPGQVTGQVLFQGQPLAGATVLVAERTGTPHAAVSDAQGRYTIQGVPPGQYVPAAVAPGFDEVALTGAFGVPWLVTVEPGRTTQAPPIPMRRHVAPPLPQPLPEAVELEAGEVYTATAPFPAGARALVQRFQFRRAGALVDSLRLYRPITDTVASDLPLLFAVYPGVIDGWEPVSVAFASQGFVLVAISPAGARGVDIDAHTLDARVALALARGGHLGAAVGSRPAVALGGSFSSAILHRLLRDEREDFAAWVTVGGISNAFKGAADFYAGRLEIPEKYALLIPALGPANLYPLPFLRYSPVYTPGELPPTLIVHTDADRIIPIDQAYELEAALRKAGVPVEVFYYQDVSHYLQVGENMTPAGETMFYRVVEFALRYGRR